MNPIREREVERVGWFGIATFSKWCICGNPSGVTFHLAKGEHTEIKKPHTRCGDCGKIWSMDDDPQR